MRGGGALQLTAGKQRRAVTGLSPSVCAVENRSCVVGTIRQPLYQPIAEWLSSHDCLTTVALATMPRFVHALQRRVVRCFCIPAPPPPIVDVAQRAFSATHGWRKDALVDGMPFFCNRATYRIPCPLPLSTSAFHSRSNVFRSVHVLIILLLPSFQATIHYKTFSSAALVSYSLPLLPSNRDRLFRLPSALPLLLPPDTPQRRLFTRSPLS
jgi:hypothetical protein